jgi:putative phosphoserine phosphatase/1-acylglycerol-3-phosphate O-acyltransferase
MPRRAKPKSAAFFDLDRTLLRGASGPLFSEAMRDVGLMSERRNPAEPLLFGLFNLVGENRPTMMATRQMARMAKGWPLQSVRSAAEMAAPLLTEALLPYAKAMIDEHKSAHRAVVLATTTPFDLIKPFADAAGFDDVVATRYGVSDGAYDGTIDGEFVWGRGKAKAVRRWAEDRDIDLADSYAYSDSYYDSHLLSMVGHPTAVNPDPRLRALATVRRWPVRWFDVPHGVPKFAGFEPQAAVLAIARPELFPWVRVRIFGANRIPTSGPAILVGNHRSYFDPLAIGLALAQRGRPVRFLGKKEVFDAPIVGDFARAMGGIRVDRGTGSDEPLREASDALAAGDMVAIMPQGTIPRGREFFNPELKGRWGAMRLAHESKAPVIPIGLWGTEKVWPRSSRMPNVLNILSPPLVTVRVGRPVELTYDDLEADTKTMMAAIAALLPAEARQPHEPTEEELLRSMPSGSTLADADPDHESIRRPGTD